MSTHTNSAKTPQADINNFWSNFTTQKSSKVTSIFPRFLYANILPEYPDPRDVAPARNAAESYEAAAKECREKVARIVQECHRTNQKFTDPDFDIESDFGDRRNCLEGIPHELEEDEEKKKERKNNMPKSVHRVDWIFTDPKFTIDGFSSADIIQGIGGNCWWLADVANIAHRKDLMSKICVVQNEECGVYGFVFHRDGEWASTVIDDNLYLSFADFSEVEPETYDPLGEKAKKYRAQKQTGSEALWFGRCANSNETWLPLLEKAFAKVHGDYHAIRRGWSGDGTEDMTGGVATTIATKSVLSKDKLWEELSFGDGDFVFSLSSGKARPPSIHTSGVSKEHAYSILHATEEADEDGNKLRFVKIRNPWGERSLDGQHGEWTGRWSDGSREWTPYWIKKLSHTFGDDGVFWMLYQDVLEIFEYIHRTRLFDEKWIVIQQWTSCDVAWLTGYSRTKFVVNVQKTGTVVLVLAQLDERYFKNLQGQYDFQLQFLLKRVDAPSSDYLCRARTAGHTIRDRSVSAEMLLEPGQYEVIPKITATRYKFMPTVMDMVDYLTKLNPQKLRQIGMQYDLAHAKGGITDEDQKLVQNKRGQGNGRRKKPANASIQLQAQIDAPEELIANWQKLAQAVGGGIFEGAARNVDGDNAQTTNGPHHNDSMPMLPIRSKVTPELAQEDKDEAGSDPDIAESGADEAPDSDEEDDSCWNAVCVTCLRVYSQDPDLTITLVQPDTTVGEPSTNLTQSQEPAGAT